MEKPQIDASLELRLATAEYKTIGTAVPPYDSFTTYYRAREGLSSGLGTEHDRDVAYCDFAKGKRARCMQGSSPHSSDKRLSSSGSTLKTAWTGHTTQLGVFGEKCEGFHNLHAIRRKHTTCH
jgi:hypothetical protein